MASGETLFKFFAPDNQPPQTNPATPDEFDAIDGQRRVLDFIGSGGSASEEAYFEDSVPNYYDANGIDIVIDYSTDGTDVDEVRLEVSAEVVQDDDDQDAGGQGFGTVTNIDDTPATATANYNNRTAAGSISHANCGSPVEGDRLRIKLRRIYNHGAGNTDDVQFHAMYVTET